MQKRSLGPLTYPLLWLGCLSNRYPIPMSLTQNELVAYSRYRETSCFAILLKVLSPYRKTCLMLSLKFSHVSWRQMIV